MSVSIAHGIARARVLALGLVLACGGDGVQSTELPREAPAEPPLAEPSEPPAAAEPPRVSPSAGVELASGYERRVGAPPGRRRRRSAGRDSLTLQLTDGGSEARAPAGRPYVCTLELVTLGEEIESAVLPEDDDGERDERQAGRVSRELCREVFRDEGCPSDVEARVRLGRVSLHRRFRTELSAESRESRRVACRAAGRAIRGHWSAEAVTVDGLRLPRPDRPWKGAPELLAERFRSAEQRDGGSEASHDCTVHARAWQVSRIRTVRPGDVPEDYEGTALDEEDPVLARMAAFCLEGAGEPQSERILAFARGTGADLELTCVVGENERRTARATSERSRGDACAVAVSRLCDVEDCVVELGGVDGIRVDEFKFFTRLRVPRVMRNDIHVFQ